ncbi:hypothetical protein AB0H18_42110 [Streptomyces sp. NPDC020766]|uniref:NucA/NucB deoxyribonuclease domain-containing protein n=1 Tax=Streptomyces sp. NPDC020766 TaxID=3155011 RepID=UPI0033E4AA58
MPPDQSRPLEGISMAHRPERPSPLPTFPGLARWRRRHLGLFAALISLALTWAMAPASAAESPGDLPEQGQLIGKLVLPEGPGNEGWRQLTEKQAAASQDTPSRSLRDLAQGQRKATLEATEDEAPPSDVSTKADYDYYSWDECRQNDPDQDETEFRHKNHFASCLVTRARYEFYQRVGPFDIWVGEYTFRITVLGRGERGVQRMRYDLDVDDWDSDGITSSAAPLGITMSCINLPNAECDTVGGGRQGTISNWQFNGFDYATFITTRSPGGGDFIHYDADRVNYHQMRLRVTSATFTWERDYSFRCDAATYVSGGGCIFHEVPATMHYSLTGDGVDDVAAHIKKAQDDPENVYPGGIGTQIPGGRKSGKPLTRLYPNMNDDALSYYNANNRIARATCQQYDPNYGTPGLQCDEYPFRSTWEGAYYTEDVPGSYWKYSAKMVNGDQNGKAGSDLGAWYTRDHILAKDSFWVQIDS